MNERCRARGDRRPGARVAAHHPLAQLTLVRVREFMREPEAVFWAVLLPHPAHRRPGRRVSQPAGRGPQGGRRRRRRWRRRCGRSRARRRRARPPPPREALRSGKVALLAERAADGAVVYRYDDTNPEGRTARMLADRAVQRAAGRATRCAPPTIWCASRLALHRFPGARSGRPRHHEQRHLGPRLLHRRLAPPQADEAPDRDADVAARTTCCRI